MFLALLFMHSCYSLQLRRQGSLSELELAHWSLSDYHYKYSNGTLGRRSVEVFNDHDWRYISMIQFEETQFRMLVDTGSADTWITGPDCRSEDFSCGPLSQKETYKQANGFVSAFQFAIRYASAIVRGRVAVGSVKFGSFSSERFPFGISTYEYKTGTHTDGILGLAFPRICQMCSRVTDVKTILDFFNINSFNIYLSKTADGDQGELSFGLPDRSRYVGEMKYEPLTSHGYWQFKTKSVSVNGNKIHLFIRTAIADTGSSLIIMDSISGLLHCFILSLLMLETNHLCLASRINKQLGAKWSSYYNMYKISCETKRTGPPITFKMASGNKYIIPAESYVLYDAPTGKCFSAINQGGFSAMMVVFGDPFLRTFYTQYDLAQSRIGFAQAIHNPIVY